jgi:hypothetical protein
MRFRMWTWWVDEQLGLVERSRLHERATINVGATIPKYFHADHKGKLMVDEVQEYIGRRYPFANLIDIRDTGEPNIYEGQTLQHLHRRAQESEGVVCYFHSKGFTSQSVSVSCWRQILNHYIIEQWEEALDALNEYDVVGVKDKPCQPHMVSGNFWWATNRYIRTRPNPLQSELYQTRPSFYPGQPDYRYSFEDWMFFGKPNVYYIVDTKADHFEECVLLEDLIEEG